MSFIDNLTRDEKEMIISLPYRIGVWVSECEDGGGEDSDELERQVLASIIDGYAREVFGSEMTQHVMAETVTHKDQWDQWAEVDFAKIPGDCRLTAEILMRYGEDADIRAFSKHLLEIGEAVAMAFSEYEDASFFEKIRMRLAYRKESARATKRGERYKSLHEFLSISRLERRVLMKIAESLDVEYA